MLLYNLGYFGPHILFILILFYLPSGHFFLPGGHLDFIILQVVSLVINIALKETIREPRPQRSVSVNMWDKMDAKQFGMPSSHAQLMGGMLAFTMLHMRNRLLTATAVLQTGLTMWQRYVCRKHTISQLLVGAAVGGLVCLTLLPV